MKLSTRMRYGARALFELAAAYPDRAVSVKEMAERQRLSVKYLEHIIAALKAAGLIKAVRGFRGGYNLARSPSAIRLSEVFRALEGSLTLVDCVEDARTCPMEEVCPTRGTWIELTKAITRVLDRTTLQDLIERKGRKQDSSTAMYQI